MMMMDDDDDVDDDEDDDDDYDDGDDICTSTYNYTSDDGVVTVRNDMCERKVPFVGETATIKDG